MSRECSLTLGTFFLEGTIRPSTTCFIVVFLNKLLKRKRCFAMEDFINKDSIGVFKSVVKPELFY